MLDEQEVSGPKTPRSGVDLRCRDLTFGSWRSLGPSFSMIALRSDRKSLPIVVRDFVS